MNRKEIMEVSVSYFIYISKKVPYPPPPGINLLNTSTLIPVSVSISVSASKSSAFRIIGIVAIAAAAKVASVQLVNHNYPPCIFSNNLPDYDSTGKYIFTIATTTGGNILQL